MSGVPEADNHKDYVYRVVGESKEGKSCNNNIR